MAADEGNIITFIFTGVEGEVIPRNATRFIAHESVKVIPARLCQWHRNIIELICHAGVERIECQAFEDCDRLRRVIIPGVKIVGHYAFQFCSAVTYVECPKLERIKRHAFTGCKSLSNIDLPSAKVLDEEAFFCCSSIVDAKFGKDLKSIGRAAFHRCRSLERITIPLKNGLFIHIAAFSECDNLKILALAEGAALRDTIAALLLEEWRNDMTAEIDSINQVLPNTTSWGKAEAIREWITTVLRKIIHYKAEHHHSLNVATTSLKHALPDDIVINYVLPFLELPSHTFEEEVNEEEEEDDSHRCDCWFNPRAIYHLS